MVGVFMEKEKLEYFRSKLLKERKNVQDLLDQMVRNEVINSTVELSNELSELSMYDNHPSDVATETFEQEKGMALKEHETTILKRIDESMQNIENGSYGTCSMCGQKIGFERLEFIPYTEFCVECQSKVNSVKQREINNRPVEEEVIGPPFGYGFNDHDETAYDAGYDAEDSYQDVQRFDWRANNDYEFLDEDADYVEPIERISNQQYRNQLPD